MKDRIEHIMRAKNLKASDLATLLGIQASGVSHILAGRNKPSLEFVKRIKETFPEYNLDWIIFGTGPITTSEPFLDSFKESRSQPPTTPIINGEIPFDSIIPSPTEPIEITETPEPIAQPQAAETDHNAPEPINTASGIKSIVILYNNGTFETYSPS